MGRISSMSKPLGPGQELERQFIASIPPGIYHHKLPTPGATLKVRAAEQREAERLAQKVAALQGQLGQALDFVRIAAADRLHEARSERAARFLADLAGEEQDGVPVALPAWFGRGGFTPRQPYDLLIVAPIREEMIRSAPVHDHLGRERLQVVQASIFFGLELKSCAGSTLPASQVADTQVKGMADAASAGHVAGLVVAFPAGSPDHLWFIPVQSWVSYLAEAKRKSMPLEAIKRCGVPIERDPDRGVLRAYWRVGEFLAHFGADIPDARAARARAAGRPKKPQSISREPHAPRTLFD